MLEDLGDIGRQLIDGLLPLYKNTAFAYSVAMTMFVVALVLATIAVVRHLWVIRALKVRAREISGFISFEDEKRRAASAGDATEAQFARRFRDIDKTMQSRGPFSSVLAKAWRRYRKNLIFVDAPPIRVTQRPHQYFYAVTTPQTWLGFSANLFVGFGLLATFVGLVAALTFAAEGMRTGDSNAMLESLRDLLAAAASKFVTSIAGVGLSILLSILERVLSASLRGNLDSLCDAIELGIRVDPGAHAAVVAERVSNKARPEQTSDPSPGSDRA